MSTNTQELDKQLVEMIDEYFPKDKRHARGQAILMIPAIKALIESAIQEARKHEAADIHKAGFDLLMKKGASAVVAGGTDLDKLLNQIEAKYGKDLIHYVYGEHNQPKPSLTNSEPTDKEEES